MLSGLFGNAPVIRVADVLLDEWEMDLSIADIARESGIAWPSASRAVNKLVKAGVLLRTRKVGKAQLYQLVRDSEVYKELKHLDLEVSKVQNDELVKKEGYYETDTVR